MNEAVVKTSSKQLPFAVIVTILILVGVLVGGGATYFLVGRKPMESEVKQIVDKVSRLMELPEDEEPTLATISDKEKLKDQAFFLNAQNGDKVLVYAKAGKAILYRPSTGKIVEVAPLNIESDNKSETKLSSSPSPSSSPSAKISDEVKVVLYNGTKTAGLTASAAAELKGGKKSIDIVDMVNAGRKDYKESIAVNLTALDSDLVKEIAAIIGATIGSLPKDEKKPNEGDLLIIIGSDYLK